MSSWSRILDMDRNKQLTFVVSAIFCLFILAFIQYIVITVALSSQSGTSSYAAAVEAAQARIAPENQRLLGTAMRTLDYAAFKELEKRKARSNDPQVVRMARGAMLEPSGESRLKIRSVRKTEQADMVNKILRNRTNGFFVECGAFDGETASNTIFLERARRWSGLLIEMDSAFYTQLVGKRRNAWSINACLSPERHVVEMNYFESEGPKGRMPETPREKRLAEVLPTSAFCFPLESLLLALDRKHVDYFSLDVTGFELPVLRSIPFDRLDIDVVSVVFSHSRKPKYDYVALMTSRGYELHGQIRETDYVFVKKGVVTSAAAGTSEKRRPPLIDLETFKEAAAASGSLRHANDHVDKPSAVGDDAADGDAAVQKRSPPRQQHMEADEAEPAVDAVGQDTAGGQSVENDAMIMA